MGVHWVSKALAEALSVPYLFVIQLVQSFIGMCIETVTDSIIFKLSGPVA